MTDDTLSQSTQTNRIRLTRRQRYAGFVVVAGLAVYSVFGIVAYVTFLTEGPVIPDRKSLVLRDGRLVSARRAGGKSKRKQLLIQLADTQKVLVYDPKAGDIDRVEAALKGTTTPISVFYHPETFAVYEIRRQNETVRSYNQTTAGYAKSLTSQAHVKGMLALILFIASIAMGIGLARMVPSESSVKCD